MNRPYFKQQLAELGFEPSAWEDEELGKFEDYTFVFTDLSRLVITFSENETESTLVSLVQEDEWLDVSINPTYKGVRDLVKALTYIKNV